MGRDGDARGTNKCRRLAAGVASLTIEEVTAAIQDTNNKVDDVVDHLLSLRERNRQRRAEKSKQLVSPCPKCGDTDLITRTEKAIREHILQCKGPRDPQE